MTTRLDLYLSAVNAARVSLDKTSTFEIELCMHGQFLKEKLDAADYDFWKDNFNAQRALMLQLSKQKSASQALADANAKTTPPPKTEKPVANQ
jgi:hypothetical protein